MFFCDTVFLERLSSDDDLLLVLGTILLCHKSGQCLPMAAHLYTTDANFVTYPGHGVATKKIQASVANPEKREWLSGQESHSLRLCWQTLGIVTPGVALNKDNSWLSTEVW